MNGCGTMEGMKLLDLRAVDPSAPQSSALQAYRILEEAIAGRAFGPGSKLPSERDLAKRLSVSRSTLRNVLAALADAELLQPSPQRGWFVPAAKISDPPNTLISFTEIARQRGLRPGAQVLSHRIRPITLAEQDELQAAPGTDILEINRLRTLDGTPVCVDFSYLVTTRTPGIQTVDLTDRSLYDALESVCGVRPVRSDYAVHADAADESTAELLQIRTGSPTMIARELTYGPSGDRLLMTRLIYRGDAYTFRATLYRP